MEEKWLIAPFFPFALCWYGIFLKMEDSIHRNYINHLTRFVLEVVSKYCM